MHSKTLKHARQGLESNPEWVRWSQEDPLWAVAAEPGRKRGEARAWTDEEFYAAGKSDWEDFVRHWTQYGVSAKTCVEVGCGAGRITRQMADYFNELHAVDVSPHMIERARLAEAREHVRYWVTDGQTLPQEDGSVQAIFSTHVFQHVDSEEIVLAYFRELFRVLDTGGTLMIHMPLYDWPGVGRIAMILKSVHKTLLMISDGLAWTKRKLQLRMMRGTACNMRSVYETLTRLGFRDIEFRTFPTTRNGVLHPFVLARKSSIRTEEQ
jgi:ubiquinone/menaquinone biosynthesis C-methylase UbiE